MKMPRLLTSPLSSPATPAGFDSSSSKTPVAADKSSHVPAGSSSDDDDDDETSPGARSTGSIVEHLTPETHDGTSSGNSSYHSLAFDSPSPSQRGSGGGAAVTSPHGPSKLSPSPKQEPKAERSSNSSFELVEHPSPPPPQVSDSRRSSLDSTSGRVLPASLLSFPPRKTVTLSAPDPNSPPQKSYQNRSRAWSNISNLSATPTGRPGSHPTLLSPTSSSDESSPGMGVRRRASYETGFSGRRSSITPGLSSIQEPLLDPEATTFSPHLFETLSLDEKFYYIVKNGKGPDGELSRHARMALKREGLKAIPSMHGPLNLPYARCPSGIDAFLFSADKEEDPWTFMLDDGSRRRRNGPFTKANPVALPGNARYSQPTHVSHGRLPHNPNRIVSAPSAISSSPRSRRPSLVHAPQPQHPVEDATTVAHILAQHAQHQYNQQLQQLQLLQQQQELQLYGNYPIDEWNSIYTRAPSLSGSVGHLTRPTSTQPYPWPTSSYNYQNTLYSGFPPALSSLPPAPAPVLKESTSQLFSDPAVLAAFGPQDAPESSYYTAESDSTASEAEGAALPNQFFFPAVPPAAPLRRTSSASLATAIPRRPSVAFLPLQPVANADRRNSAAPTITRRMSLSPAVTVSTRRQSVAAQTRLVRDPPAQASSQPTRQPRGPMTEEEETPRHQLHSRSGSESTLKHKASSAKSIGGPDKDNDELKPRIERTEHKVGSGWRGRGGRGRGGKSPRGRGAPRVAAAAAAATE
ncbi:hypothetical protein RQP46_006781 [Phenoliferia psychrophenolica]